MSETSERNEEIAEVYFYVLGQMRRTLRNRNIHWDSQTNAWVQIFFQGFSGPQHKKPDEQEIKLLLDSYPDVVVLAYKELFG